MLQFDLSHLIGARPGARLAFVLDEGSQQLEDIRVNFLRGRLQFTRIQGGILVESQIETEVEVPCTRCMELFPYAAVLEIEETIGFAGRPRPDITYRLTEEGWFEISPLLREQAWVALPMKPLCNPNCQGICPECGANRNLEPCRCQEQIDPRLAVLAEFVRGNKSSA